jgi:TfoX/Sxy family transcriptional regulator of competence genes
MTTPEEAFERLLEAESVHPEISVGRMFGSRVLKVRGKVFAMVVKGRLVVKLPKENVDQLLSSGIGRSFDPGHGKPSKEWVAVDPKAHRRWPSLIAQARKFVGSAR